MAKKKKKSLTPSANIDELGRYKALGQMMAGFVHQLRTPIHIIQSGVEGMAGPQAELIARSADRLEATVSALLNFVKGEKKPYQPGVINPVIEHLGDFLKMECQKRGVKLDKRLEAQQSILFDEYSLQEALLNLMTNALQAMPSGGTLSVISEDHGKGEIVVTISDNGTGMDAKALAKLKTPFHTTKKGGVGLGVFFAREILQQHKAKLDISSQKGKGTAVRIVFPGV
jgi:signal transduction histidine kinase